MSHDIGVLHVWIPTKKTKSQIFSMHRDKPKINLTIYLSMFLFHEGSQGGKQLSGKYPVYRMTDCPLSPLPFLTQATPEKSQAATVLPGMRKSPPQGFPHHRLIHTSPPQMPVSYAGYTPLLSYLRDSVNPHPISFTSNNVHLSFKFVSRFLKTIVALKS